MSVFNTPVRDKTLQLTTTKIWPQARNIVWRKICFDILNRLGIAHECDEQTDSKTFSK